MLILQLHSVLPLDRGGRFVAAVKKTKLKLDIYRRWWAARKHVDCSLLEADTLLLNGKVSYFTAGLMFLPHSC